MLIKNLFVRIVALFFFCLFSVNLLHAQELRKVKIQLSGKYQFQFAGFIMAKELGYYRDAGVEVELLEYDNGDSIADLESGKIDFVVHNENILYKDGKLHDALLIASYFQKSPLVLITQPEIKNPADIKGHRAAIDNNMISSSLSMFLDYFSITPENTTFVKPSLDIWNFIDKKVDVIVAFRSNEPFGLNRLPVPYNVIDPAGYGFTANAINLFTLRKTIQQSPNMVGDVLSATKKGWQYALDHVDEVARLIHDKYQPNRSLEFLKFEGRITRDELMLTNLYDIGEINKDFVEKNLRYLIKTGKLDPDIQLSDITHEPEYDRKIAIDLTKKEKKWLQDHPVVTYSEVNWKPLSIIQNDRMEGIMGDYMDLIAEKSGLRFKYKKAQSWGEVLEMFRSGEIDVVPGAGASMEEKRMGLLSKAYARYPMMIVTNEDYQYISSLRDLQGKSIAVPKYYTSYNFIKANYPELEIKETKNIPEALLLVSSHESDAFVGHIAPAVYYIETLQLKNLKISGSTDFEFTHHYLVHHDDDILLSIIDKAINSIKPEEIKAINAKWANTKIEKGVDKELLYETAFVLSLVILFLLYRQIELRKHHNRFKVLEERMKLALLASKSGISDWDVARNRLYLSPEWKKMLGFEDHELENSIEVWTSRIHPDDVGWVTSAIEDSKKNHIRERDLTYRMRKKDGSYIWLHSKSVTEFNDKGDPIRIIGTQINIDSIKKTEEELDFLAKHDPLTGLPNRVFFHDRLNHAMQRARRNGSNIALFFIDLDRFKEVNDSLGHDAGDTLLKEVSKRLQATLREVDTLARLGGDEFSVIVEDLKREEDCVVLAERMIGALQDPVEINGNFLYISISIGISFYPRDGEQSEDLLKYSDAAMYKAKREGRNNYQFYTREMTELAYERIFMEKELREALRRDDFVVYYQPQVNAKEDRIIGMEALVRWQHPQMGLLSPARFLPIAEESGLIVELDRVVMRQSLQQLYQWQNEKGFDGTLSLNLNMKHLHARDFIATFEEIVGDSGVDPRYIDFEVLENQIMDNPDEAIQTLNRIREMDVNLSIDDFGTGYSSLAYLKRLPITKLKIDRSFVMGLPDDEEDAAITSAIIALAQSLHLKIVAEGVENLAQKDYMLKQGCECIQGYYYSRPVDAQEMGLMLQKGYI